MSDTPEDKERVESKKKEGVVPLTSEKATICAPYRMKSKQGKIFRTTTGRLESRLKRRRAEIGAHFYRNVKERKRLGYLEDTRSNWKVVAF